MKKLEKKYGKKYLLNEYGLKWDKNTGYWWFNEHEINTVDLRVGKVYTEPRELEDLEIDNLIVEDGDTITVTMLSDIKKSKSKILLENINNGTYGTLVGNYYSDDARFYLVGNIAELFVEYDITIKNYLLWDDDYVTSYVERFEKLKA